MKYLIVIIMLLSVTACAQTKKVETDTLKARKALKIQEGAAWNDVTSFLNGLNASNQVQTAQVADSQITTVKAATSFLSYISGLIADSITQHMVENYHSVILWSDTADYNPQVRQDGATLAAVVFYKRAEHQQAIVNVTRQWAFTGTPTDFSTSVNLYRVNNQNSGNYTLTFIKSVSDSVDSQDAVSSDMARIVLDLTSLGTTYDGYNLYMYVSHNDDREEIKSSCYSIELK